MLTTEKPHIDVPAILKEGQYYILDDFALRQDTYTKVVDTFMEGLQKLEGPECRRNVTKDGIGQLHKHFPVEKIHLLESYLLNHLRNDLGYWSYRVGHDDLMLDKTFYLDHLMVFRIHYPFEVARKAKNVIDPPYPLAERVALAKAALKNWGLLGNYLRRRKQQKVAEREHSITYDAISFHGNLPRPARAHAAHVDTWYGHSYDGINLWWSIGGVNEDNTVILYPELWGQKMVYDPKSMYLAKGISLTKPHKIKLKPGQLLVFNPEMLHGTQVNISGETRFAITTRLNPDTPHFNAEAPFNFEYWYSSRDLAKKNFSRLSVFPARDYQGHPSIREQPSYVAERTIKKDVHGKLTGGVPLAICPSEELQAGFKMAVDLANAKVLLWRDGQTVKAYARACPHLGVDLVDGYHDDEQIFCPGHGVAYALKDGTSKCAAFKLRHYEAYEDGETIYLKSNSY